MTSLVAPLGDDGLYTRRMGSKRTVDQPHRRRLRVQQDRPRRDDPVPAAGSRAVSIADVARPSGPEPVTTDPISAIPNRNEPADRGEPIPSNLYFETRQQDRIDPSYRGIRIANDSGRTHHMTPEHMQRAGLVLDRTDVDPYTGERVDHYRHLPPDGNKDYRLPDETMGHVNRRLIALQGYDHTQPKPSRRERMADLPQPDGRLDEAGSYMRRIGEMQERITRQVQLNLNGERPPWMRERGQAAGHVGYQNMHRFVPNIPVTQRADTQPLPPTADFKSNPNPSNETRMRGIHRTDAKRPHVELNEYLPPAMAANPAPPIRGLQRNPETNRAAFETEPMHPGPGGITGAGNTFRGEQSATRRRPEIVRNVKSASAPRSLASSGAAETGSMARQIQAAMERAGHKLQGMAGAIGQHLAQRMALPTAGGEAPKHHRDPLAKRAGTAGTQMTHPNMGVNTTGTGNPMISTIDTHVAQKRADLPLNTGIDHSNVQNMGSFVPMISTRNEHPDQKRNALPQHLGVHHSNTDSVYWAPVLPTLSDHQINKRNFIPTHMAHTMGNGIQSADAAPVLSTRTDRDTPMRADRSGVVPSGYGQMGSMVTANPNIPQTIDRVDPAREGMLGAIQSGLARWREGAVAAANIPKYIDRVDPQREIMRVPGTDHLAPVASTNTAGSNTLLNATFDERQTKSGAWTVEAAKLAQQEGAGANIGGATDLAPEHDRKGHKLEGETTDGFWTGPSIEGAGSTMYGDQSDKLATTGKRAATGAMRPGVSYTHGGANAGSAFQSGGVSALQKESYDRLVDRTRSFDIGGEKARANTKLRVGI